MIEFFNNIWAWICSNKESITAVLTSVEFTALAGLFVSMCKNISSSRKNTLSINSLTEVVSSNNSLKEDVEEVKDVSSKTNSTVSELFSVISNINAHLDTYNSEIDAKFNCLFEMFSVVYSTIKDESVRLAVTSILNNAKHARDVNVSKLQEENLNLKEKLQELSLFVEQLSDSTKTNTSDADDSGIVGHRRY